MKRIGAVAIPPKGTIQRERVERMLAAQNSPARKREMKRLFNVAANNVEAQALNGAPLPAPDTLREFLLEYSGRAMRHGLYSFPLSFNVGEAFYEYDPKLNSFDLLRERDCACRFVDLLEVYTSLIDLPPLESVASQLPDGEICSFSFVDSPCYTLTGGDGEYSVRAASIVRRSNQVSIIITAGDHQAPEMSQLNAAPAAKAPVWKEGVTADPLLKRERVSLDGQVGVLRAVFLTRIDTTSGQRERTTYLRDYGDHYAVSTDDTRSYVDILTGELMADPELIEKEAQVARSLCTLTDVSTLMCYAMWCIEKHRHALLMERHPTRLRREWPRVVARGDDKFIARRNRHFTRNVEVLAGQADPATVVRSVRLPRLRIEHRGYWKRLADGDVGMDRNGRTIAGKTWVQEAMSWYEGGTDIVNVKESLPQGADPGYVYVLRCAAHVKDLYKVGLTRRTVGERAVELSSHTGVPDVFHVIASYPAGDCRSVEALIHQSLGEYRLRNTREFFLAPLTLILAVIGQVLEAGGTASAASGALGR